MAHSRSSVSGVTSRTIWLLALTNGLTVANLYYCQPLLPQIAASFSGGAGVGSLVTLNQVGYALGLVVVVPLGDILRRRLLVCALLCVQVVALAVTAAAPNAGLLLIAGTVLGIATSSVLQILLPYAATIAAEHERGRAVGTMVMGSLTGVLLSRTVAGLIGEVAGWRGMFVLAAVVTALLAVMTARVMAPAPPELTIGYRAQLRETVRLAVTEPVLRRRSMIGACVFAAFGAFWATVAYLLAGPNFRYGGAEIGTFALVGAAGAIVARPSGRAADRGWQRPLTGVLLALGLLSYAALWAGERSLPWLIAGVLVMDVAIAGTHLLNMSVVYGLVQGARSRIASVYMTAYTLGGVAGSAAGTAAFRAGGWSAVSAVGALCMLLGLAAWVKPMSPSR